MNNVDKITNALANELTSSFKVSKFGGSSMADAEAIRRSASLAKHQKSNVIVVSATYGTTNAILSLIDKSLTSEWEDAENDLKLIKNKHYQILKDLNANDEVKSQVDLLLKEMETIAKGVSLLKDCSAKAMDSILSLGERMSSALMTLAINEVLEKKNALYFDVRKVLKTDDYFGQAVPQIQEIEAACKEHLVPLLDLNVIVTQGFIGQSEEGFTTTLGRGGSDYSAALLAEGIGASIIEIWTDVAGVATTDPRICKKAKAIEEITYQEACELATFGAKVLHPTTLWPAIRKNIAVFVGSSIDSNKNGTWIRNQTKDKPLVRAIALRDKQALLTLTTPRMVNTFGFMYRIFKVFNDHKISVDLVTTSEISVAITVNESTLNNKQLVKDLSEFCDVKMDKSLSLVSLVGNNISETAGLSKEVFSLLEDINIRMICSGASSSNICFLVDTNQANSSLQRLHNKFLE